MRILVVDDSKAMRMIVIRTLRQAGYAGSDVGQAENGREALSMIEADAPDLVLSDWNMPEMNGIDLLRTLRASGNEVIFGFVTAENSPATRELAATSGARFVIAKPFDADSFGEALDRAGLIACLPTEVHADSRAGSTRTGGELSAR